MEQILKTVILGIIQGLTEWLPISSTGHLRLAEQLLNTSTPILLDVLLHLGTLVVLVFYFRNDLVKILSALIHLDSRTEHGQLIAPIVVGSIPTALIGLAFGDIIENTFKTALPLAAAFIMCGSILYLSRKGREKTEKIALKTALIVGIAQGIAVIPGISRSGTTIAIALLLGTKRERAFKFSFLLSVPTIVGALAVTAYRQHDLLTQTGFGAIEILVGVVLAMAVGYAALLLFKKIIMTSKLHFFAVYCWAIAVVLIAVGSASI